MVKEERNDLMLGIRKYKKSEGYLGIVGLLCTDFDHVGVHVDEREEIEAHGWGEATQHHTREDEGVLISLVVWCQVVQVEHTDLEEGGVRTQGNVCHGQGRDYLRKGMNITIQ